jgi:hypothetical protein
MTSYHTLRRTSIFAIWAFALLNPITLIRLYNTKVHPNDKLKKAFFALRPLLPSSHGVDLCLEFCTSSLTFLYKIFRNMQIMASVNP